MGGQIEAMELLRALRSLARRINRPCRLGSGQVETKSSQRPTWKFPSLLNSDTSPSSPLVQRLRRFCRRRCRSLAALWLLLRPPAPLFLSRRFPLCFFTLSPCCWPGCCLLKTPQLASTPSALSALPIVPVTHRRGTLSSPAKKERAYITPLAGRSSPLPEPSRFPSHQSFIRVDSP